MKDQTRANPLSAELLILKSELEECQYDVNNLTCELRTTVADVNSLHNKLEKLAHG